MKTKNEIKASDLALGKAVREWLENGGHCRFTRHQRSGGDLSNSNEFVFETFAIGNVDNESIVKLQESNRVVKEENLKAAIKAEAFYSKSAIEAKKTLARLKAL